MNYSVRNIVIAGALALFAIVAVVVYTSSVQQSAQQGQSYVSVLVATRDIPAGTTAEEIISKGLLAPAKIVQADRVPGALTSTATITGQVAAAPVYARQQVVQQDFSLPTNTSQTPIVLQGNQRAFSLTLDPNDSLSTVLHDGDHIDIYAAYKVQTPASANNQGKEVDLTMPLMSNILVLQAGVAGSNASSSTGQTVRVLLKVTDIQAQQLLWAEQFAAGVQLAVRPASGAKSSATQVTTLDTMVTSGLNPRQRALILKKTALQTH